MLKMNRSDNIYYDNDWAIKYMSYDQAEDMASDNRFTSPYPPNIIVVIDSVCENCGIPCEDDSDIINLCTECSRIK